jgi:hypothetical protein
MSISVAAEKLKAADEALAAAKVIRGQAFEELVAAVVAEDWRIIYRHDERIVFEPRHGSRTMALEDILAEVPREGATA